MARRADARTLIILVGGVALLAVIGLHELMMYLRFQRALDDYEEIQLLMTQDLDAAASLVADLLASNGPAVRTLQLQREIAMRREDLDTALAATTGTIQLAPYDPEAHLRHARLLAEVGRPATARLAACEALALAPGHAGARALLRQVEHTIRQPSSQISALTREISSGRERPRSRRVLINLLIESGQTEQARLEVERTIVAFPTNWRWHHAQSRVERLQGRYTDAAYSLRTAIELHPTARLFDELIDTLVVANFSGRSQIVHEHAQWLAMQGTPSERAFMRAVANCRKLPELRPVVRRMVEMMGSSRAARLLETHQRHDRSVAVTMVLARFELDDNDFDSALHLLQSIAGQVPMNASDRRPLDEMRRVALRGAGRVAEAAAVGRRNRARYGSAATATDVARPPQGRDVFLKAVTDMAAAAGDNPDELGKLGWLLFQRRRVAEGTRLLTRSVELAETPENCLYLAYALNRRGTNESRSNALKWARRARDLAHPNRDRDLLPRIRALLELLTRQKPEDSVQRW
ncbi:MAG: hypothetical protein CMJ18_20415 [Phycisphaeraceae bacterium]|nr:hypothetical protein [Phycisphaeraceae bacterium]